MCTWSCEWRNDDVTVFNFTGETSAKFELLTMFQREFSSTNIYRNQLAILFNE